MTLLDQLQRDEGLRLKPYTDTVGKLTIGYGRNLTDKGISAAEARLLLEHDIEAVAGELARFHWFQNLDSVRQAALINMGFMGLTRLVGFGRMIAALEQQDWVRAAAEVLDSRYAEQVKTRAQRIAQQVLTGEWV